MANSAANCLIAQARAEGMVEALELLKALEAAQIEPCFCCWRLQPGRGCRNWSAASGR